MNKFRIIALDGGGIRGLYTAALIQRIEEAVPGFLSSTKLFTGTSTGGILALGFAMGRSAEEGVRLYQENGATVFERSIFYRLRTLFGASGPRYPNANLKRLLEDNFHQTTLGDIAASGKYVLIPTYDLEAVRFGRRVGKAKFFHNFPEENGDGSETAVDVAMRTAAGPTLFPTYQGYIDGGISANNPAMSALAQALDPATGGQERADIRLISFGTGTTAEPIAGEMLKWGFLQWAVPVISLILDAAIDVSSYHCEKVLGSQQFLRINPLTRERIPADAASQIDSLLEQARTADLDEAISWIQENFI